MRRNLCYGEKMSKDRSKARAQPAQFMGAELRPFSSILDITLYGTEPVLCASASTHKLWPRLEFRNNEALTELMRGGLGRGRGDAAIALVRRL